MEHNQLIKLASSEEEEEEEEVAAALQGRQSQRLNNNNNNNRSNGGGNGNVDTIISNKSSSSRSSSTDSEIASGITCGSPNSNNDAGEDDGTHNSVYFDNHHGNGVSEIKCGSSTYSCFDTSCTRLDVLAKNFVIPKDLINETNHHEVHNLENEGFSGSCLRAFEEPFEEQDIKSKPFNYESILGGASDLIEEGDQEETELDVEGVLQKQNTHDLYCPNCNSCITRRVILRRRKPKVRTIRRKPKLDKVKNVIEPDANSTTTAAQGHDAVSICPNGSLILATDDDNHDRDSDVFRCLSCFSFFIPTGNGFKLFRVRKDIAEDESIQNPEKLPATNANWFSSIFATDRTIMTIEKGSASQKAENENVHSTEECKYFEEALTSVGRKSDTAAEKAVAGDAAVNQAIVGTVQQLNLAYSLEKTTLCQHENGHLVSSSVGTLVNTEESGVDGSLIPHGGVNSPVFSTPESLIVEESRIEIDKNLNAEIVNEQPVQNGQSSQGFTLPNQLLRKESSANDASIKPPDARKDALFSYIEETPIIENVRTDVGEKVCEALEKNNTGNDVIVIVETEPQKPTSSSGAQTTGISIGDGSSPQSGTQMYMGELRGVGVGGGYEVEVLKSIVYGGLIESITSLSVVSSAAGAGATTLNILALGLANLIGGLLIIGHHLIDLKNGRSGGLSNQTNEQEDRYQETLGRRDNFPLHATVTILSYLIFGMLPPVIYGFSFLKSDDKDLKIAVVGIASLFCIILLALGKAYVQRQPKSYINTILYFAIIGFMASGASFIVGDLTGKLLEKVGLLESNLDATIPFPGSKPVESAWAFY